MTPVAADPQHNHVQKVFKTNQRMSNLTALPSGSIDLQGYSARLQANPHQHPEPAIPVNIEAVPHKRTDTQTKGLGGEAGAVQSCTLCH